MGDPLLLNGELTTTDQGKISVEDRGLQFGDSIYEVLRFSGGRPHLVRPHYERMQRGLTELGIVGAWPTYDRFVDDLKRLMDATDLDEGIVYVQVTKGVAPRSHWIAETPVPTTIAYTRKFQFMDERARDLGLKLVTTADIRWARCDLKTTNLLGNVMGKALAKSQGADEALFIENGFVTECSVSNFFGVIDGTVVTHPVGPQILPGVVRDEVIRLALAERIRVDERAISENELYSIEEAFATSTTMGPVAVTQIDGRVIGSGRAGDVTRRLGELFAEHEATQSY